jgi:hypothetical protein
MADTFPCSSRPVALCLVICIYRNDFVVTVFSNINRNYLYGTSNISRQLFEIDTAQQDRI